MFHSHVAYHFLEKGRHDGGICKTVTMIFDACTTYGPYREKAVC